MNRHQWNQSTLACDICNMYMSVAFTTKKACPGAPQKQINLHNWQADIVGFACTNCGLSASSPTGGVCPGAPQPPAATPTPTVPISIPPFARLSRRFKQTTALAYDEDEPTPPPPPKVYKKCLGPCGRELSPTLDAYYGDNPRLADFCVDCRGRT